ncbi:hypothetical protein MKX01_013946 [Papaver californicum]|nr:hypothetical protein MKX01_013946 [Papaver californicum]
MKVQNQYKDNNGSSSSKFKWRIENISKLNEESCLSPIFTIGPHKWRLLAFHKGRNVNGYLSVYVVAVECKISRCAKFGVAILGQTNNTFKDNTDDWITFTEDEVDWGFDKFIQLKELKDPSNGYIVNDACTVEVELCLNSNSKEELAPIALMESAEERDPVTTSTLLASNSVSLDKNLAPTCAFCQTYKVSEKSGSMFHIANGKEVEEDEVSGPNVIHVHLKCLLWAPQVYYVGEIIMNLEMEVGRGSKLKCSCCGLKGAALGCYIPSCCRWYDEGYLMLCPSHSGLKFPHEKTKNLAKDNYLAVHSQEPPALGKLVKRSCTTTQKKKTVDLRRRRRK